MGLLCTKGWEIPSRGVISPKMRIERVGRYSSGLERHYLTPDPDDVPCFIELSILNIERELRAEYAKLGISMPDLSDEEKEKFK